MLLLFLMLLFRHFIKVALVVKECMEGAINLCVPLEVKMKAGQSWGSLSDYHVPDAMVRSGETRTILDTCLWSYSTVK
jgi:hypothetical protein